MTRKIFRRVGLRRDFNFADLSDPKEALNNLLDTLVDDIDSTFISEDLNAIRNIFAEGLTNGGYQDIIGSAVQTTDTNGINQAIVPRITYQNRLDKFEVTSGSPRLNGGNGLTANYFNQDAVEETTEVFTGISTGGEIPSDTFWEMGNFDWTGKIHPQSVNAAGGVKYEGYFIPQATGVYNFSLNSSLGYTADFQKDGYEEDENGNQTAASIALVGAGNTYTEQARVGLAHTVTVTADAANDKITVPITSLRNVGYGMSVSGSGIREGTTIENIDGGQINIGNGEIILSNSDGDPLTSNGSITATFFRNAGIKAKHNFNTYLLEKYRRYRVRFRVFVPPGTNGFTIDKNAEFTFDPPDSTSNYLRYNNLYSLDYDFTNAGKGDFNKFLDQSVLFGGGLIGGTTQPGYVKVKSLKKVDIKYVPKTSLGGITRKSFTADWTAGSKRISVGDTTDIEVGNYIFASTTGLTGNTNTPVRVVQVITNLTLIVDQTFTGSGTGQTLTVINHRGFVKRVTASASSGTLNMSNGDTAGLKSKMIAIWNGGTKYTGITTSGNNTQITLSPSQGFGTRAVYFYESRGLVDQSLTAFCVPAQTRCLIVTSNATTGDTSLTVESTTGVGNGWTVQGFPFNPGTTVNGAPSGTTVNLNQPIIKDIAAGANFTVTNSGGDRQLCCPPTDTSPPFNPTEEGLNTTASEPNLKLNDGNIKFDEFTATIDANKVSIYSASDKSNNRLKFRGGDGVTYDLLCV
tara:strand:+ start:263 stop:2497 length:2235 start_codon:yes stop_codon:yes gene_type:complete